MAERANVKQKPVEHHADEKNKPKIIRDDKPLAKRNVTIPQANDVLIDQNLSRDRLPYIGPDALDRQKSKPIHGPVQKQKEVLVLGRPDVGRS